MKIALGLLLIFLSQISFSQPMNQIDPKMIQSFAPTGTLRVGINLGNPVLAGLDASNQKPKG
jgi:polar amino acid transport system substrate-binding protein